MTRAAGAPLVWQNTDRRRRFDSNRGLIVLNDSVEPITSGAKNRREFGAAGPPGARILPHGINRQPGGRCDATTNPQAPQHVLLIDGLAEIRPDLCSHLVRSSKVQKTLSLVACFTSWLASCKGSSCALATETVAIPSKKAGTTTPRTGTELNS
jgi:hypothetical protein